MNYIKQNLLLYFEFNQIRSKRTKTRVVKLNTGIKTGNNLSLKLNNRKLVSSCYVPDTLLSALNI